MQELPVEPNKRDRAALRHAKGSLEELDGWQVLLLTSFFGLAPATRCNQLAGRSYRHQGLAPLRPFSP
jgi:hypothetical protein